MADDLINEGQINNDLEGIVPENVVKVEEKGEKDVIEKVLDLSILLINVNIKKRNGNEVP